MKRISIFICMAALSGCVTTTVDNVKAIDDSATICIVRNPEVGYDFLNAYARKINAKGYKTEIVASEEESNCTLTTTYAATYGMHWGLYLASADLKVFRNDKLVGSATYRAPYVSPAKHKNVEGKIGSLVNELF